MINRLLDIRVYEPELTRVERTEQHPTAWIVVVDGFLAAARQLPDAVEKEVRQRGLIPDFNALRAA